MKPLFSLSKHSSFRHGVHPEESKELTEHKPIERLPFVDEYVIPLSQHLGAPSIPVVDVGARVKRGQMIARPAGFISTAQHAPVTGKVVAIDRRPHPNGTMMPAVVIKIDPYSSQKWACTPPPPVDSMSPKELADHIQNAGMVGLGGAAFPSHVKFLTPEGKTIQFAFLNGCECEPFLTCDHRVMLEDSEHVIQGLLLLMRQTGAEKGFVGVENNKPDAIEALRKAASNHPQVEVVSLQVKYPQGAEKMLIDAVIQREVPSMKLPLDVGCVVNNVGTVAAIARYFETGIPLAERVVTVTGDAVAEPKNLVVPLGTPLQALLEHCRARFSQLKQVISGGPMMGAAQKDLTVPVVKGTSGLLTFDAEKVKLRKPLPCVRCGRCLQACPMFLNPSRLAMMVDAEKWDDLEGQHVLDCFECGSCAFSCPSFIPLAQKIRLGKAMIRQRKRNS